jgi:hypothetical protein
MGLRPTKSDKEPGHGRCCGINDLRWFFNGAVLRAETQFRDRN